MDDLRQLFWVLVGSVIIAGGSAIAGIMSFQDKPWWVFVGFLVFVIGYWSSQMGTNGEVSLDALRFQSLLTRQDLLRLVFSFIGLGGIALGVTLFSQTVLDPDIPTAALSGISSIGGYMFAHVGINRDGVGESLFKPVFDQFSRGQ